MESHTCSYQTASKQFTYGQELRDRRKKNSLFQIRRDVYAVSNCDSNGILNKKYVIIKLKYEENDIVDYACSCGELVTLRTA